MNILEHALDPIRMHIAPVVYKELMPVCKVLRDISRQFLATRPSSTVTDAVANLLWSDDVEAATKELSAWIHFSMVLRPQEDDVKFGTREIPTRMAEIIVDHPGLWCPFFVAPIIDADIPLKRKLPFLEMSPDAIFLRYFEDALRLAPGAHNKSLICADFPSDQLDYVLKRVGRAAKHPSDITYACPFVKNKTDQVKLELVLRALLNMPITIILSAIPPVHNGCFSLEWFIYAHNEEIIKLEQRERCWSACMIHFVSSLMNIWLSSCPLSAKYVRPDWTEMARFRQGLRWLLGRAVDMRLVPFHFLSMLST
jgi:hypothetical protein